MQSVLSCKNIFTKDYQCIIARYEAILGKRSGLTYRGLLINYLFLKAVLIIGLVNNGSHKLPIIHTLQSQTEASVGLRMTLVIL